MLKSFAIICLLALAPVNSYSQLLPAFGASRSGTAGMQFLKLGPDARSNSLGGAVIAEINDPAAVYWNPSGIVGLDTQQFHMQFGHSEYFAGIGMSHAAMVWQPNGTRSFGISVLSLRSPEMDVTTEFMPRGTGQTFGVYNNLIAFSFAQVLTSNFKFGLTAKYANENIAGVQSHSGLVDFGFQYAVGLKDLRFGVAVSNFGFNVNPQGEIRLITLNGERQIENYEEIPVPATFQLGFSGTVWQKDDHQIKGNIQLNHPTDNQESVGIGFEYDKDDLLFIGTGYVIGSEGNYPSFGAGIDLQRYFGNMQINYCWLARNTLGSTHQISLGIAF